MIYLLGGEGYENKKNIVTCLDLTKNEIREILYIDTNVKQESDCYCVYVDNTIFYNFGDKLFECTL